MQTIDFRHQLHIYRRKIILALTVLCLSSTVLMAQARYNEINRSGQDDRLFSYGFFLATHTNYYRLKYSDLFVEQQNASVDNVHSIVPVYTNGFSMGFLMTMRLQDQVNLLFTPKIGFYEFRTEVNYLNPNTINPTNRDPLEFSRVETVLNEATMVEFPLLLKYKAQRFNNSRMFFTGGGSFMFRTKAQEEVNGVDFIATYGRDFTLDLGLGFDMYFRYFKFSPEIRFSHGLLNLYSPEGTDQSVKDAISELRRKSITLYLNFQ